MDRSRAHRGRAIFYHPTDAEAGANPNDWVGVITDVNVDGTVDAVVESPNVPTIGSALTAVATADAATQGGAYVQADVQTIATLANALKAAYNVNVTLVNQLRVAVVAMRKAGLSRGPSKGQYDFAPIND